MAQPKPRFTFEPRLMTARDVVTYLNRSEQWLATKRGRLEAEGFPCPDPVLGLYDQRAVDLWLDRRSGIIPASSVNSPAPTALSVEDPFMAAFGK